MSHELKHNNLFFSATNVTTYHASYTLTGPAAAPPPAAAVAAATVFARVPGKSCPYVRGPG